MTELINIVFIIISLIWITSFPIVNNNITLNFLHTKLSVTEKIVINLGIFSNILLILSFYNINQKIIFYALLVLPLFNFFYLNKKINLKELYLIFIFVFILSVSISSNLVLEWDAAEVWIYKVINFYNNKGFQNLSGVPGDYTYPHLGSYIWSLFWNISFVNAEYTGRIFYVFTYTLSILLIINFKNILPAIILTIGFYFLTLDYYLLSGYQEYLVFSFLIFIFYFYQKYSENFNIYYLIPIFLFINTIIWFKNEATFFIIFFFIFIFSFSFFNKKKIKLEIFLLLFLFIISVLIKYYIFFKFFQSVNTGWLNYQINEIQNILNLAYFMERSSSILFSIFVAMIKCKTYLVFFITIIFFHKKKDIKIYTPFIIFMMMNIIFIYLIYYLTNDTSYKHYLATTVDRLLFQTSGIYLIAIMLIIKDKFIYFR